jgi:serine/threonine protein kinase
MSWGKDQRVNSGRYQILDRIGTGGFGVTYRAISKLYGLAPMTKCII